MTITSVLPALSVVLVAAGAVCLLATRRPAGRAVWLRLVGVGIGLLFAGAVAVLTAGTASAVPPVATNPTVAAAAHKNTTTTNTSSSSTSSSTSHSSTMATAAAHARGAVGNSGASSAAHEIAQQTRQALNKPVSNPLQQNRSGTTRATEPNSGTHNTSSNNSQTSGSGSGSNSSGQGTSTNKNKNKPLVNVRSPLSNGNHTWTPTLPYGSNQITTDIKDTGVWQAGSSGGGSNSSGSNSAGQHSSGYLNLNALNNPLTKSGNGNGGGSGGGGAGFGVGGGMFVMPGGGVSYQDNNIQDPPTIESGGGPISYTANTRSTSGSTTDGTSGNGGSTIPWPGGDQATTSGITTGNTTTSRTAYPAGAVTITGQTATSDPSTTVYPPATRTLTNGTTVSGRQYYPTQTGAGTSASSTTTNRGGTPIYRPGPTSTRPQNGPNQPDLVPSGATPEQQPQEQGQSQSQSEDKQSNELSNDLCDVTDQLTSAALGVGEMYALDQLNKAAAKSGVDLGNNPAAQQLQNEANLAQAEDMAAGGNEGPGGCGKDGGQTPKNPANTDNQGGAGGTGNNLPAAQGDNTPPWDPKAYLSDLTPKTGTGDGVKTEGIAVADNGEEAFFQSGYSKGDNYGYTTNEDTKNVVAKIKKRLQEAMGVNAFSTDFAGHVEKKVAQWMRDNGLKHADLVINNPDGPCANKEVGCTNTLKYLLAPGQTLTVYWPDPSKPNGMASKTFP